MNLQTLTQGSIVMYEGYICKICSQIDKQGNCNVEFLNLYNRHVRLKGVNMSDLHPVPITPELLDCISIMKESDEDHYNDYHLKWTEYILFQTSNNTKKLSIFHKKLAYEGNEELIILAGFHVRFTKELSKAHLHDFQYAIKLDGLDFEIALEQLKYYTQK